MFVLLISGVRKYGKDFQAIADVIGNKTEAHVRSFFVNYRRRYNLDEVLAEFEAEHGMECPRDNDDDDDIKIIEEKVSLIFSLPLSNIWFSKLTCQELPCFHRVRNSGAYFLFLTRVMIVNKLWIYVFHFSAAIITSLPENFGGGGWGGIAELKMFLEDKIVDGAWVDQLIKVKEYNTVFANSLTDDCYRTLSYLSNPVY